MRETILPEEYVQRGQSQTFLLSRNWISDPVQQYSISALLGSTRTEGTAASLSATWIREMRLSSRMSKVQMLPSCAKVQVHECHLSSRAF